MAFPFVTEAGFEAGSIGHFDVETDTQSKLDVAHYATLARDPRRLAPFRGAYCMRVDLSPGTADAYLQETGSWDLTAGTNDLHQRFMLWIDPSIAMADTNEFAVMEYWSGTNTAEAGVYLNFTTANGLRLGIGKGTASVFKPITTGVWHCVETFFDPAGGAAGTLDARLDDSAYAQVTALTNANITSGVLGVVGQDAGTTAGILLFDEVVADDTRIFPIQERYPKELLLTASGHVFVGIGQVESVSLFSGAATDNVLELYDTDVALTTGGSLRERLQNSVSGEQIMREHSGPIMFHRGCYVSLSGTNPRALVRVGACTAYSEGAVRQHGLRR